MEPLPPQFAPAEMGTCLSGLTPQSVSMGCAAAGTQPDLKGLETQQAAAQIILVWPVATFYASIDKICSKIQAMASLASPQGTQHKVWAQQ